MEPEVRRPVWRPKVIGIRIQRIALRTPPDVELGGPRDLCEVLRCHASLFGLPRCSQASKRQPFQVLLRKVGADLGVALDPGEPSRPRMGEPVVGEQRGQGFRQSPPSNCVAQLSPVRDPNHVGRALCTSELYLFPYVHGKAVPGSQRVSARRAGNLEICALYRPTVQKLLFDDATQTQQLRNEPFKGNMGLETSGKFRVSVACNTDRAQRRFLRSE